MNNTANDCARFFFLDSKGIGRQRKEKRFWNKKYDPKGGDFFLKPARANRSEAKVQTFV
jgi:hypothetical protein